MARDELNDQRSLPRSVSLRNIRLVLYTALTTLLGFLLLHCDYSALDEQDKVLGRSMFGTNEGVEM